jgi:hypothetical protein
VVVGSYVVYFFPQPRWLHKNHQFPYFLFVFFSRTLAKFCIFYAKTDFPPHSSWMNIANLDPLTAEILATPPTNIKSKGLLDAYQVAQEGFGLEQVKKLQASEVMDVDTAEEDAAEEDAAEEEAESMEVDEPESEADKKSKKAKKRKLSTSDEDPETSEKPAKTPKKAAAKAKTPKTKAAKTPKTPKTPANGTTAKAAAKPKASTAKKEKAAPAPKSTKKKTPARSSKAKSAEKVDESDSEREEASSEVTKEEEKDSAEFQMKQVKQLRGRLQRGFLTKDTPPLEKVSFYMCSLLIRVIFVISNVGCEYRTWPIWLANLTS